jgi:exonuclease III
MNTDAELLHQGDDIVLTNEYNFSESMFDLNETQITPLSGDFSTVGKYINLKLKNCDNLLKLAHVNARSIPKHAHEIEKILLDTSIDILGVSETFISQHTPENICKIPGYNLVHVDRDMQCRGGVGIYLNDNLEYKKINLPVKLIQPEMLFLEVSVGKIKIAVGVMYKSPLIPYSIYAAIHENLVTVTSRYDHCILMGDMNINHLKPDLPPCKFFSTYVSEPFALTQVIDEPTRITANSSTLIDLMLVSNPENVKVHGVVDTPGISDHCLTFMSYSIKKPKFKPKMLTRRDFRNFDSDKFKADMAAAPWGNIYAVDDDDVDNKVTIFENIHREIIDKHAPMRTFRVTRPATPWLTDEIKKIMDERDRYKNKFNKEKKTETEIIFKDLRNKVTHAIRQSKIKVFNDRINTKFKNPKVFHQALKNFTIVESKSNSGTECTIDPTILNQAFVKNNNAKVNDNLVTDEITEILKKSKPQVFRFEEISELEVLKIVRSIKTNACGVDGISAFFLKLGIEHSVFAFTEIINSSFKYHKFPERFKKALVKPIPKIPNPLSASDFRPISLLPAFSKIIEKVAAKQMIDYLRNTGYLDNLQSAYKQAHSTTTALLSVTDDIYEALENSELTFLVLLDYSKAFDCANHRLISAKLKAAGLCDDALSWVSSYLSGRSQKVVTGTRESGWEATINGVPQGSVLGPLLFTVLVSDIKDAIKRGRYHLYADDTQLYYTCKVDQVNETIDKINSDLSNISRFSKNNCLKLNAGKSKFIIIGSRPNLKKLKTIQLKQIKIDNEIIEREHEVKNLGVVFDETMSWARHVNLSVAKAYGKLKNAWRFNKFLSEKSKFSICETYILSNFNYCDTILQNMTKLLQDKIQKVQNRCIRFIYGLRKYDHISHFRKSSKILSMQNRRQLHSLTMMFRIKNGLAPSYLCERITRHSDVHNHNTRNRNNIIAPFARSNMRAMSFFIYISKSFNELSNEIKITGVTLNTF